MLPYIISSANDPQGTPLMTFLLGDSLLLDFSRVPNADRAFTPDPEPVPDLKPRP